ncbi:FtsK/SpoIIIE domain-containing protein [Mangrovihabitans endophyticus]|uniref:Cell division protein FtsK n=1 Tax=Mangrovihabitans endophyticus TaxID=1751298 RepID=A0A8J3FQK6_9ACTN|nr:FtsK/SpoIIIE domain-containing protein [Mangrovihabitans endophyticus]GGK99050.1 cell division protein FtsK [Mangrovihabitans endophyticus]
MGRHRHALVAAVRQDLAEARGSARAMLAAAEAARAHAQQRRRVVRDAYALCLNRLADARHAARTDIRRRFGAETAALVRDLTSLAAHSAAGAAGTPWRVWSPTEPRPHTPPSLLRIGTITIESATVPALVPLLNAAHVQVSGDPHTADGVIAGLLLRAVGTTRPGDLRLTLHDHRPTGDGGGGALAAFAPLGVRSAGPERLTGALDALVEQIRRHHESPDPDDAAPPWHVVVLLADPAGDAELTGHQQTQLARIVRDGTACGIHLLVRGLDLPADPAVHRIALRAGTARTEATGDFPVRLDPPPPSDRVSDLCRSVADRLRAAPPPVRLANLLPDRLWTESAAHGLHAVLGPGTDGNPVEVPLDDRTPHALVGGPSGSGRTTLLHAWIASLIARYGPAELALYLLDFSGGTSFARFAPGARDPSWLPHARLAGVNIAEDREFGLAVLRRLGAELRVRCQAAKRLGAADLAQLRAGERTVPWPRILLVVDDFTNMLAGRDALADETLTLLGDLAHRGGAYGVHLVLSGADVRSATAVRGRSDLLDRCALRLALPGARRLLADGNLAAALIPRFHAVVNTDGGAAGANRVVRLPDAADRGSWTLLQRTVWRQRPASGTPPRLFDGNAVPRLPARHRPSGRVPGPSAPVGPSPGAVLGERVDVTAGPAEMPLGRMPGRNLAVLGGRADEACDILASASLSLAAQGAARFSIACLHPGAEPAAARLAVELPEAAWYDADGLPELLAATRFDGDGLPHYVIGYGLDAAGTDHRDVLRSLLTDGPERCVHLLGWWRSVSRLCSTLSGTDARFESIGAWVALDVRAAELGPLGPQPDASGWRPRRRRALYFDRTVHRMPEVLIPYEVNNDHT